MAGEQLVATLKANPISVACGALALALGVGIYFRSNHVPDSEAQLEQKSTLGYRIADNLNNGKQLAEQYAAITAARRDIEMRLIRPDEKAKNQQFFYKLEADTGAKIIELRQNVSAAGKPGAKAPGFYTGISFSVSVRGDYVRLLDFLRRLESNQRFCRILSATMGPTGGADSRGNELTLTLGLELLGQQ